MEIKPLKHIDDYYATSNGDILDKNKEKVHTYPKDGYNWISLEGVEHKVAELILTTFVPVPSYIKSNPMANHFNFDRSDDRLENLDWVDRRWNAVHIYLMEEGKKQSKDSYVKYFSETNTGQTNCFKTLIKIIGAKPKDIWEAIKSGEKINGFRLNYISKISRTNYGEAANKSVSRNPNEFGESYGSVIRTIKILDVNTKEVKTYESMMEAAKAFGVKLTHIRNRISTPEKPKMLHKRFIIVDADKDFKWVTPAVIKMLKSRGSKHLVVYDEKNKTFTTYPSAKSFMEKHSGFPTRMKYVCKKLGVWGFLKFEHFFMAYVPEDKDHEPDLFLLELIAKHTAMQNYINKPC